MACKESVCRKCFHSYVCEKFNENKDDNNEKCHFFNDHYVPTADVVPRAMIAEIFGEIEKLILRYYNDGWYTVPDMGCDIEILKKKYTEGRNESISSL